MRKLMLLAVFVLLMLIAPASAISSDSYDVTVATGTSLESASSPAYDVDLYVGGSLIGKATSASYSVVFGVLNYIMQMEAAPDTGGPSCYTHQNVGMIRIGGTVVLTATCTDESGVTEIVLSTDETKEFKNYTDGTYNSPAIVSGTTAVAVFTWSNSSMRLGESVIWKVYAKDAQGMESFSSTKLFTLTNETPKLDSIAPVAAALEISDAEPVVGDIINVSVVWTDNIGLSSAALIVDGKQVDLTGLSGTQDTAVLEWVPIEDGTHTLSVTAYDSNENIGESEELSVTVAGKKGAPPATYLYVAAVLLFIGVLVGILAYEKKALRMFAKKQRPIRPAPKGK